MGLRVAQVGVLLGVMTVAPACGGADAPVQEGDVGSYSVSGPTYESVTALAREADAVFTGHIVDVHARETDNPSGDETGVPVVLYEFAVDRVLAGTTADTLYLLWWDVEKAQTDAASDLSGAETILVFADSWTDSPGIESVAAGYTPLMFDNGVFDVEGDVVTPRSDLLVSLRPNASSEQLTPKGWPIDQIIEVIRSIGDHGAG